MDSPLVSVVLTTHKREPSMVKRSIMSVLNQTYRNIELIVVDDSPDNFEDRIKVEKMIKSIKDNRVKYIKNEENIGACASRNIGISFSRGTYFMYFDDDDVLLPRKIELSLGKFKDGDVGLVYSENYVIDAEGRKRHVKNKKISGNVFDELIKENFVLAFPLLRKESLEVCGKFDPGMQSMQDYDLWLRIAKKYKFEYVSEPLSIVYHHIGERISTDSSKKVQGAERIYEKHYEYLQSNRTANSVRLLKLARLYMSNNQINKAKKTWVKAWMIAPYNLYENIRHSIVLLKNLVKTKLN